MSTESKPIRLLIVDDEAAQMQALCDTLSDHGYETTGFTKGQDALDALRHTEFELLLADLMMPEMDGIALLEAAQHIRPHLIGVIMTGEGTIASAVEAMRAGALDYILKPFKLSVVLPVLARALTMRRLRMENAELERSVRERTIELEAALKELEAFSYSASHDLRAPLTVIAGYTQILSEDYATQMSDDARQLVHNIERNTQRMMQLIDDLLRLSRLGRQPLSKKPIDMAELVRNVLEEVEELQKKADARTIDVRVGELPNSIGDLTLLHQVFLNLLSNAFKFTRGKEHSVIEVDYQQQQECKVYFVRDNGAGFDMQRASRLFSAFQRLHSISQFEGTGVGLSIVQRIIQRHGGRVWAEAAPNEGATFYFSLPE